MHLKKIEGNIFYPGNDQFTEHILYNKDSDRFSKDLAYGEEAEIYVLKYLKKHYKQFEWYSCKQYCVDKLHIDYSSTFDTIFGDIIALFDTGWAAMKINVKRTTIENKIATATHYGKETDIFNSDLRGFTFYLSTGVDVKDVSNWEVIWADCLVHERPVRIKENKYIWDREQLDKYALPFDKVMEIVLRRKDKGKKIKYDSALLDELESLYKTLNADKLHYNSIIGKPKEDDTDKASPTTSTLDGSINQSSQDSSYKKIYVHSHTEGKFGTLGEAYIQIAEKNIINENKDTIFYIYKQTNGVQSKDGPLKVYYSDIKDNLDNLYKYKSGLRFIKSSDLEKYAR